MLQVLQNYHPLGAKGDEVFRHLNKFVLNAKDKLSGANIQNELETLNKKHGSIFSSNNFVACVSSQQNKRGYTCSLWTLFHYLTIKAERLDICREPLQVLRAIHGYVKFFFGCEECSNHFQEMAERRKIWHVSSKAEAALWLWEAHNEVNNRTAGDATEDPKFPKIQFPSESSCSQCHKAASWDKDAVLNFLKNMYNPDYVSRYGTDTDNKSGTILRITSRNI
ncbi:sulfhydryl oxidase 1-like [Eurosta solidaginis]